jgi:hypothetical protein
MEDSDDEFFGIDEGNEALREYASHLTDSEKEELLLRLKEDEPFAALMRAAIDQVNNLFTVAAVGDEDDYQETREEMVQDIDNRESSVHRLRMHFLENRDDIDMSALLSTPNEEEQYERRLDELREIYSAKHA